MDGLTDPQADRHAETDRQTDRQTDRWMEGGRTYKQAGRADRPRQEDRQTADSRQIGRHTVQAGRRADRQTQRQRRYLSVTDHLLFTQSCNVIYFLNNNLNIILSFLKGTSAKLGSVL